MDGIGGGTTYFVSRHHEHPPATLEELLRASNTDKMGVARERRVERGSNTDDVDSDSDYQCEDENSDDDLDNSEPEVDEGRLHATEPREGLYLYEMRRQRGRMDEKEAQWVRGYIKAQRAWKARTGRSIDDFPISSSTARQMKKSRSVKRKRSCKSLAREYEEEEANASLFTGITRLETLLLLAAIVFVCLSLGVQLNVSVSNDQKALGRYP